MLTDFVVWIKSSHHNYYLTFTSLKYNLRLWIIHLGCIIMVTLNLIQKIGNLLAWTKYNNFYDINPDNKVHGANMGPIWGRQDSGGSHVGPSLGNSPVDSLHKGTVMHSFDVSLICSLNKLLSKQLCCCWFERLWHSCDITLIIGPWEIWMEF